MAGLVAGTAVYGSLAWLSVLLPAPIAVVASVVVLGVALRFMQAPDPRQDADSRTMPTGWWIIAMRATVSLLTALGLLMMADRFGAAAGGAVGAYPIFTVTLCAFVYASAGAIGVQRVLFGMVRGLPAYLAFVLVYGLTASHLGAVLGCITATLACLTCYVLPALRAASNRCVTSRNEIVQSSA